MLKALGCKVWVIDRAFFFSRGQDYLQEIPVLFVIVIILVITPINPYITPISISFSMFFSI